VSKAKKLFNRLILNSIPEVNESIRRIWMNNPEEMKRYLLGLSCPPGCTYVQSFISPISSMKVGFVEKKRTKDCFSDLFWLKRCCKTEVLNDEYPEVQPCEVSTLAFSKEWTFIQVLEVLLSAEGVKDKKNWSWISSFLIENNHILIPAQIEEVLEIVTFGDNNSTGMYTHLFGTSFSIFCFIPTKSVSDPVVVGEINYTLDGLAFKTHSFKDPNKWNVGYRLLIPDIDTRKFVGIPAPN